MGIFGKIKNILFEPDDEEIVDNIPVYTKEEVKEVPKKEEVVTTTKIPEEPPIKQTSTPHVNNVKRDIEIDFEAKNVLGEVPGAIEAISKAAEEQAYAKPRVEDKPSPFQAFDEKEFERVNSRLAKNEHKNDTKPQVVELPARNSSNNTNNSGNSANYRKMNNVFSSTGTNREIKTENNINSSISTGKKPFTPSPVISPVYGILDKNYKKEEIVDRQGGMKREKVVKPIIKEESVAPTDADIDIDSVRKKAYGTLDDIEKEMEEVNKNNTINEESDVLLETVTPDVIEDIEESSIESARIDDIDTIDNDDDYIDEDDTMNDLDDDLTLGDLINSQKQQEMNKVSIEDELEDEFEDDSKPNLEIKEQYNEKSNDNEVQGEDIPKPRLLDDMEKTSTLQILDDIEKELNSIKPINKDIGNFGDEDMKEKIEKSETLENDLFNLIDSMYEQGEEEEND